MLAISIIAVICLGILLLFMLGVQSVTKFDSIKTKRFISAFYLFIYVLIIFPIIAVILLYVN